ncbi:MAG: DUF4062 domain-containing protein [Calditrichia bacterium]
MKVFISSTYEDLAEYRIAVRDFLKSLEHEPLMLPSPVDDDIPDYKKLIDETEVFIGIYAHRYGILPKGDEQSLIEQEYRYAVQKGKDILCYIVDPDAEWPEKWKEDDFIKRTRLEAFLENLRKDHPVANFREPQDILRHSRPFLDQFSDIYDRLKHLHNWSIKLPETQKLAKIAELAKQFQSQTLNGHAFQLASLLISRDFLINKNDPAYPLIDDVEKLLKNELSAVAFAENAPSGYSIEQVISSNGIPKVAIFAVPALIVGLLLGAFFFSGPNTASAPEKAKPVMTLAVNDSVETATTAAKQKTETPPETEKAAPKPAETAQKQPEKQKTPSETESVKSTPVTTPAIAETQPAKAEPEKSTPETASQRSESAQKTTEEQPQPIAPATENTRQLQPVAQSTPQQPESQPESQSVTDTRPGARIIQPENLVVCADVNRDTRMPEGVADTLSAGTIWMWARLTTDRADSIRAEWFLNGVKLGSKSANIPVASPGYRIYFSRYIEENRSGAGKLVLFNGNNEQIGERNFWIASTGN